jgi:ketosteroid isomerase-like protein
MKSIIVAVLLLAASTPALADAVPAGLALAVRAYDRATVRNDTATLDGLVTDDFVLVNSDGSVEGKRQFLADFHLPGFKIDPYAVTQKIEKVWGDGAVMGGLRTLSWTQDGRHQSHTLRIAYVWRKFGGRWRATYGQVTRVAP